MAWLWVTLAPVTDNEDLQMGLLEQERLICLTIIFAINAAMHVTRLLCLQQPVMPFEILVFKLTHSGTRTDSIIWTSTLFQAGLNYAFYLLSKGTSVFRTVPVGMH